jgi:hypothetical protein
MHWFLLKHQCDVYYKENILMCLLLYYLQIFVTLHFFDLRASLLLGTLSIIEPLCQPFFVLDIFDTGSHKLFAMGWPPSEILLMSASWIARIIDVSHWCSRAWVMFEIQKNI